VADPSRGDIWLADFNPIRGHEQAGQRPVLVISEDLFNKGLAGHTCQAKRAEFEPA